jgi:hypothetical protein
MKLKEQDLTEQSLRQEIIQLNNMLEDDFINTELNTASLLEYLNELYDENFGKGV